MITIRHALLFFLILLGFTPAMVYAIDEGGSSGFLEDQAIVASVCAGGETDPVIEQEVFTAADNIECFATGSITLGPSVIFEDGSGMLLGAPLIRVLGNAEFQSGSTLAIKNVLTAQVPKTGQITCYDASGLIVTCAGSGQDGDLREGVAWPVPRFTVQGDGTVKDNLTGLVWMANPECLGRFAYPNTSWVDAIEAANSMADGECGLSDGSAPGDWRIPNIRELISLFDYEFVSPALPNISGSVQWQDGDPFSGIHGTQQGLPNTYWSSTSYSDRSNLLWCANVYDGNVILCPDTAYEYVWMVRGGASPDSPARLPATGQFHSLHTGDDGALQKGVAWPEPRFRDNLDGTVTDWLTGLIWLKDAGCTGYFSSWSNALIKVQSLADGKCNLSDGSYAGEWRLPNLLEMLSLVHYGYDNPALPDTAGTGQWQEGKPFSNVKSGSYWTATTHSDDPELAWAMVPRYGEPVRYPKTTSEYVWPVRDGP